MIYADTSALGKLVSRERETPALLRWLATNPASIVTSSLAGVELTRAAQRRDPSLVRTARGLLDSLLLIPLDGRILDVASTIGTPSLRSLDALHLATALDIGESITAFITYDRPLGVAAEALGLSVIAPGARSGQEP